VINSHLLYRLSYRGMNVDKIANWRARRDSNSRPLGS
jgi:hypothetical protein